MVLSTTNHSPVDAARVKKTPPVTKKTIAIKKQQVSTAREAVTGKRFSPADDIFLCRAYCNVFLVATKCKGDVFWGRVKETFDALRIEHGKVDFPNEWSLASCRNRYLKTLAAMCGKFAPFLRSAKEVEKSGWGMEDYMKHAAILWIQQHGKPFKYQECMRIVMRLPKFGLNNLLLNDGEDSDEDEDNSKPSANRVIAVHGASMERPMGTKKAKARAKALAKAKALALQSIDLSSSAVSSFDMNSELKRQKTVFTENQLVFKQRVEWRKMAQLWMAAGNMEKAKYYLLLVDDLVEKQLEKQLLDVNRNVDDVDDTATVPSAVDIPKIIVVVRTSR